MSEITLLLHCREKELAKVVVKKEDIELIVSRRFILIVMPSSVTPLSLFIG